MRNHNAGMGQVDLLSDPSITDPATGQQFYPESGVEPWDKVLAASTTYTDQSQFFSRDADVMWIGLAGTSTGAYQVQFTRPDGRQISSAPVNNENIVGTAQFPVAIWPAVRIPAGGKLGLLITDTSGAPNTVQIVFFVIRLYRVR